MNDCTGALKEEDGAGCLVTQEPELVGHCMGPIHAIDDRCTAWLL